jgi:isopropylmalate/homocitrate/citramalate synthase
VDFAGEDASRAELGYMERFLREIHNRIAIFFVSDTVGCLTPSTTSKLVSYLKGRFSCGIGMHAHNDFGMATANTVESVLAGADCFSGTFTGIGERAGNAPTEEVCTALRFLHGRDLGVRLGMVKDICAMVQEFSGVAVQKHKPVVGENAFAHESGVHVDGMLKDKSTYEPFEPGLVGQKRRFCLGKHSGRKAVAHSLEMMRQGFPAGSDDVRLLLRRVKTQGAAGDARPGCGESP